MEYDIHDTILFVENLSASYSDRAVIKNINLIEKDVSRPDKVTGQMIAFVGRSGRGKSTLFRALTGLVPPSTGKVLIRDTFTNSDIVKAKEVEEGDVGFVDQKYTLFRHKTIYQTLLFALRKSTMTLGEKENTILSYLKEWGLEAVKDQYPNELSGGQRQRTAIIEQILCSGHYIVLDEPFSGLDVGNIEDVKESLLKITSSHTLNTVIFSTHDIELAVELADSIYVIGYPKQDEKHENCGTIVAHFDLKKMGIAWKTFGNEHMDLVKQIKAIMLES